jgi:hypothetical protein
MKSAVLIISLLFVSSSYAGSTLRQATLTTTIEKVVAVTNDQGLPAWVSTPVCTKKSLINVYKTDTDMWEVLVPDDLSRVQCDGELKGQKVSVTVGAAVALYQDANTPMKVAALFLSWGDLGMEVPQIVHSPATDPWLNLQDVLGPVSSGKIVDGVPQPPEPSEYFTAVINIVDENR